METDHNGKQMYRPTFIIYRRFTALYVLPYTGHTHDETPFCTNHKPCVFSYATTGVGVKRLKVLLYEIKPLKISYQLNNGAFADARFREWTLAAVPYCVCFCLGAWGKWFNESPSAGDNYIQETGVKKRIPTY